MESSIGKTYGVDAGNTVSMGVPGYGTFTLTGTREFFEHAEVACDCLMYVILKRHVEQEAAAGKSLVQAAKEFNEAWQAQAKACAGHADGERVTLGVKIETDPPAGRRA